MKIGIPKVMEPKAFMMDLLFSSRGYQDAQMRKV